MRAPAGRDETPRRSQHPSHLFEHVVGVGHVRKPEAAGDVDRAVREWKLGCFGQQIHDARRRTLPSNFQHAGRHVDPGYTSSERGGLASHTAGTGSHIEKLYVWNDLGQLDDPSVSGREGRLDDGRIRLRPTVIGGTKRTGRVAWLRGGVVHHLRRFNGVRSSFVHPDRHEAGANRGDRRHDPNRSYQSEEIRNHTRKEGPDDEPGVPPEAIDADG